MRTDRQDRRATITDTEFQRKYEGSFAYRTEIATFMNLPAMRGYFPGNHFDVPGGPNVVNLASSGIDLALAGAGATFGTQDYTHYMSFGGAGYLTSASAQFSVSGTEVWITPADRGLTVGGWFWSGGIPAGSEGLISKYGAGTIEYMLFIVGGTGQLRFRVSQNGVAVTDVTSVGVIPAGQWNYLAGRWSAATPNQSVQINSTLRQIASGQASIFNGAAPFNIAGWSNGTGLYTGWARSCFVCGAAFMDAHMYGLYELTRAMYGQPI